jgi:hypothetical protein
MKDETATQVNDVLGRECSEQELSQFEAYVDALGGGDIEEAIRLFDQFPAEDHEPLIEFMCRKLDAAAPPPVELAPVAQEPRPDPDEASVTMSEHVATVSRWGERMSTRPTPPPSKPSAPPRPQIVAGWRVGG